MRRTSNSKQWPGIYSAQKSLPTASGTGEGSCQWAVVGCQLSVKHLNSEHAIRETDQIGGFDAPISGRNIKLFSSQG
jgi:hypothetical protein